MKNPKIAVFPEIDWAGEFFESCTYYCQANYVAAIQEAGGVPIIVPQGLDRSNLKFILEGIDGICLVGGPGITMGMTGELAPDLKPVNGHRIHLEIEALANCRENKKPVLGICYGMQLLNVFMGGTLLGDLHTSDPPKIIHSPRRNNGAPVEHRLHLNRQVKVPGHWEFLAAATVNSYHLQSIDKLGRGFACIASAQDGVAEVIESTELPWIGCQFHPERCLPAIRKPIFERFLRLTTASDSDGGL